MISRFLAALGFSMVLAISGFGDTLSILPTTQMVMNKTSFMADVQIAGVGSTGVGDYDLTVGFDPSILSVSNVAFYGFLGGPADSLQTDSISSGSVEFAEVSLLSPSQLALLQPGSFLLATITFSALEPGSSSLQFNSILADDANANPLSISSHSASVTVVPEPSAVVLLGIALTLLLIFRVRVVAKRGSRYFIPRGTRMPLEHKVARAQMIAIPAIVLAIIFGSPELKAQPFTTLPPAPFTASLYGTVPGTGSDILAGIAFDLSFPTPNLLVAGCDGVFGMLWHFDGSTTTTIKSTPVHPLLPSLTGSSGCGLTNHPDGHLYANTLSGVAQLSNTAGSIGTILKVLGSPGNNLGIAVDPLCSDGSPSCTDPNLHRVVYVAQNCRFTTTCDIRTVDFNTGDDQPLVSPSLQGSYFIDGIAFSYDATRLFLATRFPALGVTVIKILSSSQGFRGTFERFIPLPSEPDGISFSPGSSLTNPPIPPFVLTNNDDATMTQVTFTDTTNYVPASTSYFARGGFRGDHTDVGADGSLYITQQGTRFNDGSTTTDNSIVNISGPPGIFAVQLAAAALTLMPLSGANVVGSTHTVTAQVLTGASGNAAAPLIRSAAALAGLTVTFQVIVGPNAGLKGTAVTDASGKALFSYQSNSSGIDFIQASITSPGGAPAYSNDVKEALSATVCDVNADGIINSADISLILLARNTPAEQGDLRDANADGIINVTDARICTLRCTNSGCK